MFKRLNMQFILFIFRCVFFFSFMYFVKNEIKRWLKDLFHTCSLMVNILINLKFHGFFEKENATDLHSLKVSN